MAEKVILANLILLPWLVGIFLFSIYIGIRIIQIIFLEE